MEINKMKLKFIENVGCASTTAWIDGKRIGDSVNAAAYENIDGNVVLRLESNGAPVRGVKAVTMSYDAYCEFTAEQRVPLFIRGITLFNADTAWIAA